MEPSYSYESNDQAKATPVREASTFDKLNMELRSVLDEQEKALHVLSERLSPVLRPEPEKMGPDGGTPHPIRSPLADQLVGHVDRIAACNRRIHEFIHCLDT